MQAFLGPRRWPALPSSVRVPTPHPWLTDERSRTVVVDQVRDFLAGDATVLDQVRVTASLLLQADRDRPAEPSSRRGDWNLIADGLALGAYPRSVAELLDSGFNRFLNLEARGAKVPYQAQLRGDAQAAGYALRDDEPVDAAVLARAVHQLREWRQRGCRVYVHDAEGRSLAGLVTCLFLMQERDWDYASSLWFVRWRRRGTWPRSGLLTRRSIDELSGFCRESGRH